MHCQDMTVTSFRSIRLLAVCAYLVATSGCSICCNPYLEDYAAFSTKYPRLDMKHGRVGSVFSDPQLTGSMATQVVPSDTIYSPSIDDNALPPDSIRIESSQIGTEIIDSNDESIR